jgi:hypothetical protein
MDEVGKLKKKIKEIFCTKKHYEHVLDLADLLLTIIIFSHIFACTWIFVARYEKYLNIHSWLDKYIGDENWIFRVDHYIIAYYYATVTMVTVGYGDIVP